MSREEFALEILIRLDNSETGTASTETEEISIHRISRHCYGFHPERPVTIWGIDQAIINCRDLVSIYAANSILLRWYHGLV